MHESRTRTTQSGRGQQSIAAALAGGGAALAFLALSWWPGVLVAARLGGLVGPIGGFGVLGVACGLAAGFTGASCSERSPVRVALGAWAVWALGIAILVATQFTPTVFGWAALPAGLVAALVGAGVRTRGAGKRAPGRVACPGLLGALGAFAVLALGVAALGWAARLGLQPRGATLDSYNIYLRGMGAALWAVIILATALSVALPIAAAGWTLRNAAAAAALALVLFLALGGLAGFVFDFYLACTAGTPLPPFAWLARDVQC